MVNTAPDSLMSVTELFQSLLHVSGNVSAVRDFAAVRTERGRPLPVNLSVLPV